MAYRKIEDSKLTSIANTVRSKLGATVTMTPDEMPSMIEDIGIGYIPSYWKSYLASKATEIDTAINAASANRATFLWYTDAHWTTNYGQSPMILKYLSKHTDMKKTFFGGDVSVEESGEMAEMDAWHELVKGIPNHHSVIGNHDIQVSELPSVSDWSNYFLKQNRTGDMAFGSNAVNGGMYYYIDDHIENTRYICLSTGRMWTNPDEVEWCAEVLNSTPQGWHIVIVSHLWLNNDYTNGGIITTPVSYTQGYLDMFDAYNYRLSGTESFTNTPYNFTNAKAKIEFVIGGHVHQDYDFATAQGIPVILTESDSWQERDDVSVATKGTTTENCVYAIVADYSAKVVKVINVGRGETRSKTIPDVVTYTNLLPKAIDATGAIYNGKGYADNMRFTGDGGEKAETGWYLTGYIPVKIGQIIRFKNHKFMDIAKESAYPRCQFQFFNASFTHRTSSDFYTPDKLPSAAWAPVYNEDGDIKQVTVPTAYNADIAYVRICFRYLDATSIITVNEEIG